MEYKYKRILLKLSGESLAGETGYGINSSKVNSIVKQIKKIRKFPIQIGIVIGGGNIWRGMSATARGFDRVNADYMGMLATVINALAVQNVLESHNIDTRLQTNIEMQKLAEPYIRRRAIRHLEKGRIVIFAAGTGNPYFTTDTAAVLKAIEIKADIILKATNVDGVYTEDPRVNPSAKKFKKISYLEAIQKRLKIMDITAFSLCMENKMPIIVFNLNKKDNIKKAILGEKVGTVIK
ncbi:UMP kinase [bacterium]|nr:UMP kinase [bacterium]